MKKLVSIVFALIITVSLAAQNHVSYTVKALSDKGYTLRMMADNINGEYIIVATFKSQDLQITPDPVLLLKTMDDTIVTLDGIYTGTKSSTSSVIIGNMVYPVTDSKSTILFPISEEQIEMLRDGVKKARFSTVPTSPDKEFKNGSFGQDLYLMFKKIQPQDF